MADFIPCPGFDDYYEMTPTEPHIVYNIYYSKPVGEFKDGKIIYSTDSVDLAGYEENHIILTHEPFTIYNINTGKPITESVKGQSTINELHALQERIKHIHRPQRAPFRAKERELLKKIYSNGYGYVSLNLIKNDGKPTNINKHTILGRHFIPKPPKTTQIDHIDNVQTNNSLSNLRWVSSRDNMLNRTGNGNDFIFIDKLPEGYVMVSTYNKREFNNLAFHENYFYVINSAGKIRQLPIHKSRFGYYRVQTYDTNDKLRSVSYRQFKKEYPQFTNLPDPDAEYETQQQLNEEPSTLEPFEDVIETPAPIPQPNGPLNDTPTIDPKDIFPDL
jgi:hypothetical protein